MIYEDATDGLDKVFFPVGKFPVFVKTEAGRIDIIPGKKALVNEDTRRVLSVVSNGYRLLRNEDAYELGKKFCITAFPNTAPANWKVYSVEAAKTGGHCRIDLHYTGQIAGYDWSFSEDLQDAYRPFVRISNSYNRTCAFGCRFGLIRWACRNGMVDWESAIDIKLTHDKNIEKEIETQVDQAKFRKVYENLRNALMELRVVTVPKCKFLPIMLCVLNIRKPENLPADREENWSDLEKYMNEIASKYIKEHGETGNALVNALTDFATRPPYKMQKINNYNFIRKQRHQLQRLVGIWMRDFSKIATNPSKLEEYFKKISIMDG